MDYADSPVWDSSHWQQERRGGSIYSAAPIALGLFIAIADQYRIVGSQDTPPNPINNTRSGSQSGIEQCQPDNPDPKQ